MSRIEDETQTWEEPCPKCGGHDVLGAEINDDDPEAIEHVLYFCKECGQERGTG